MKKLLIPISFCLLVIGSATAQDVNSKELKKQNHFKQKELAKQLDLTKEQKEKAKAINKDFKAKAAEIKNNESVSPVEVGDEMKALHEQRKAQMEANLTDEQKAKLQALKTKKQGEGRGRQGERFDKIKSDLQLTPDQDAKLKTQREATQQQIKAIRSNTTLGEDAKKQQIQTLQKQQKEGFEKVLTKEQLEKLKASKKHKDDK
jgi:hypothetical protein